jgi:hypothetical protein
VQLVAQLIDSINCKRILYVCVCVWGGGADVAVSCNNTGTVLINIEGRSCNHCCSEKVMSFICCECVSVALGFRHAMRLRHIVACGLPQSTVFSHIISQTARFSGGEKNLLKTKCVF